jgi:hypothetical protein
LEKSRFPNRLLMDEEIASRTELLPFTMGRILAKKN